MTTQSDNLQAIAASDSTAGPLTVSGKVLAAIVNLSTQRLGQLAAEGMPRAGSGGYPLAASVQWLLGYWRKRAQPTPLNDARRRKAEAEATRAELDLAEMQSRLAPIAVLEQAH
jgi:phage terminase Nu1 subunit (DNA packaging protein)